MILGKVTHAWRLLSPSQLLINEPEQIVILNGRMGGPLRHNGSDGSRRHCWLSRRLITRHTPMETVRLRYIRIWVSDDSYKITFRRHSAMTVDIGGTCTRMIIMSDCSQWRRWYALRAPAGDSDDRWYVRFEHCAMTVLNEDDACVRSDRVSDCRLAITVLPRL